MEEKQWLEQRGKRNLVIPGAQVLMVKATSTVSLYFYGFSTLCFHATRHMHARVLYFLE